MLGVGGLETSDVREASKTQARFYDADDLAISRADGADKAKNGANAAVALPANALSWTGPLRERTFDSSRGIYLPTTEAAVNSSGFRQTNTAKKLTMT